MKKTIILLNLLVFAILSQAQDFELIPYRTKNKWGFVNSSKKVIIKPKYEDVIPFNLGYAAYKKTGKWGFIDKNGNITLEPRFDSVTKFFYNVNVIKDGKNTKIIGIEVFLNGKKLIVDVNGDNIVKEQQFEFIAEDEDCAHYIIYKENNRYGIKDYWGDKILLKAKYEDLRLPELCYNLYFFKLNNKWGCLNKKFEEYIDNIYDSIEFKHYEFLIVYSGDKCGILNKDSSVLIPIEYNKIVWDEKFKGFYVTDNAGKMGYLNDKGECLIKPKYESIIKHNMKSNVYSFQDDGKWGYIDEKNNIFIGNKYLMVNKFIKGYALVTDYLGKKGYINTAGVEFFK